MVANDAVYIFDEVGSGKTISSGLMAMDYLYNNLDRPNIRVLVISHNALIRGEQFEPGQFEKDWFSKLPFHEFGMNNRIEFVNNNYTSFEPLYYNVKKHYGLIIIDEAQHFLEPSNMRNRKLIENTKCNKVVMLTATPIKNNIYDLGQYVNLAESLLGRNNLPRDWISDLNSFGKDQKEVICNRFDPTFPATRYFKDTIMSLTTEGFQKITAKRLCAEKWEYGNGTSKNDAMLAGIEAGLKENLNSHFVIFTRFVEREAKKLGEFFKDNDYVEFPYSDTKNTYKVVTGENAKELPHFQGTKNNPTVLILTYQIAEQGLNLPGFNHIINYHISSYPSSLEQRFGRIDRMGKNGSQFQDIHMCYLLDQRASMDTSTMNFYTAVRIYMDSLISHLPSKNSLLDTGILADYKARQDAISAYVVKIETLAEQWGQIPLLKEYHQACIEAPERLKEQGRNENVAEENIPEYVNQALPVALGELHCRCDPDLFSFINEHGITLGSPEDEIKKNILNELKELKQKHGLNKDNDIVADCKSALDQIASEDGMKQISDKIFYKKGDSGVLKDDLATIDGVTSGEILTHDENYKAYKKQFIELVKFPLLLKKYTPKFSVFFEQAFLDNDFHNLFPLNGNYQPIFNKIREKHEVHQEDWEVLTSCGLELFRKSLPFFKWTELPTVYLVGYRNDKKISSGLLLDYLELFLPDCGGISYGLSKDFISFLNDERVKIDEIKREVRKRDYKKLRAEIFYSEYKQELETDTKKYLCASNWTRLIFQCTSSHGGYKCYTYNDKLEKYTDEWKRTKKIEVIPAFYERQQLIKSISAGWNPAFKELEQELSYREYQLYQGEPEDAHFDVVSTLSDEWGSTLDEYYEHKDKMQELEELESTLKGKKIIGSLGTWFLTQDFNDRAWFQSFESTSFYCRQVRWMIKKGNLQNFDLVIHPKDLWSKGFLFQMRLMKETDINMLTELVWGDFLDLPEELQDYPVFVAKDVL